MHNTLNLVVAQNYVVIMPFIDGNWVTHSVGEEWIFIGYCFYRYEVELFVEVIKKNTTEILKFQWKNETQA